MNDRDIILAILPMLIIGVMSLIAIVLAACG
jgi:hypothetical protein